MKHRRSRIAWPWLLIGAASLIVNGAACWMLGVSNATHIAFAGLADIAVDGFAEGPFHHRIPVLQLQVDPRSLAELRMDLPWSGGVYKDASLLDHGIRYPIRFRLRGAVAAAHFLGEKKSFRIKLPKAGPFEPYREIDFLNAKTNDMLSDRTAYWMADRMGVATPFNQHVFVRLNDADKGVMLEVEHIGGHFEQVRHLARHQVPVFKGDDPPIGADHQRKTTFLWAASKAWSFASGAKDSTEAWIRLRALIGVICDTGTSDHIDTIATLLDLHAYLRYCAAIALLGTWHVDNHHNQWLVRSEGSGLFYPVLWDPLMLFTMDREPFYPIHDALSFVVLHDGPARLERDRCLWNALRMFDHDGAFDRELTELSDQLLPSVLADREKQGWVTSKGPFFLRYSSLQWANAIDRLRAGVHAHWAKISEGFKVSGFVMTSTGSDLRMRYTGAPAVRCTWTSDSGVPEVTGTPNATVVVLAERKEILIHPSVSHSDNGDRWSAYAAYVPVPVDVTLHFPQGAPSDLQFINAITDERITPQ